MPTEHAQKLIIISIEYLQSDMILKATASSTLPSEMKCFFRTSGWGFPDFLSNTSSTVNLEEAGEATPGVGGRVQRVKIKPEVN